MNILELKVAALALIESGKGEAKLYVSDGGAGVAMQASIYAHVDVVGTETAGLDGEISEEAVGTPVVFIHYN